MKTTPPVHTTAQLSTFLGELLSAERAPIGVLQSPRLAKKLAQIGRPVISLSAGKLRTQALESWSERGDSQSPLTPLIASPLAAPLGHRRLSAIVAVGVFGSHRVSDIDAVLCQWRSVLQPNGVLAVAELAGESRLGRVLLRWSRWMRRRPTALDPADLCRSLLTAGVKPVHQVWPQGLGSWVLTFGRVAPLTHLVAPNTKSATSNPAES
jgi:hypothetical protein